MHRVRDLPALPHMFAVVLALPLVLPIPGFLSVPPLAMGAALICIPLLLAELCLSALAGTELGALRRASVLFVLAATASWIVGIASFGFDSGAALSYLNWIALVAVAVVARATLASARRIGWMVNTWVASHAVLSVLICGYLVLTFGAQIISSADRGPFQMAMRQIIPSWPNYFGVALATAVCVVYARIVAGANTPFLRLQMFALVACLITTFSRGSYLACLAGIAAITLATGSSRRVLWYSIAGVATILVVGVLVPAVSYQFLATFEPDTSQSEGVLERVAFAREALIIWWAHPAFGIGFSRFSDFADPALVYVGQAMQADLGSVHNEYLTTLLKGGWVVALTLVVMLRISFRMFRSAAAHPDWQVRQWGMAGIGIAVTLFVAGFALESLRTIGTSAIFWALMGALDGTLAAQPGSPDRK